MRSTRRALFGLLPFAGVAAAQAVTDKDGNVAVQSNLTALAPCKPDQIIRFAPESGYICTDVMETIVTSVNCGNCKQPMINVWMEDGHPADAVECVNSHCKEYRKQYTAPRIAVYSSPKV